MSEELTPEKAQEYHEVACLLCLDIDLLDDMVYDGMTGDKLLAQVKHLIKESKKIRTNAEHRNMRFKALTVLFGMVGAIPDTGVHEADKEQPVKKYIPSSEQPAPTKEQDIECFISWAPGGYNSKYRSEWSLHDLATEWMDKASGEGKLAEGLTCEDLVNGYLARNNGKPDPFPE